MPRYNEFRKLLHRSPVKSFEELTDNRQWRRNSGVSTATSTGSSHGRPLRRTRAQRVRLFRHGIPHLLAHGIPTAKQRPFLHDGLHPQGLHQAGLDGINNNDMSTVLLRHFPGLLPSLRTVKNAFAPRSRAV